MNVRTRRLIRLGARLVAIAGSSAFGAGEVPASLDAAAVDPSTTVPPGWSFSGSVFAYFVPEDRDYAQPTLTADHGALHLEARYQYEAFETGSAWVGYNLSGGGTVLWEFTPMLGGVFGATMGVAPGYRGALSWWRLEFFTEGEWVFDVDDRSDSFMYNWSELRLSPVDWFHLGIATQRTRAYASDREVQWGPLAGFSFRNLDLTGYLFNLDRHTLVVLAAGVSY